MEQDNFAWPRYLGSKIIMINNGKQNFEKNSTQKREK